MTIEYPRAEAPDTGYTRMSVAPMMDWTDRHCRYLHRLLSKKNAAVYRNGNYGGLAVWRCAAALAL